MAARIFGTIVDTHPAVVVDLHNDWIRSIPYTVVDPIDSSTAEALADRIDDLAAASGFPIVIEETAIERTLTHSLVARQIPALTIELAEAYVVNEVYVQLGIRSCFAILEHLNMVDRGEPFRFELPSNVEGIRFRYSNKPFSSTSGIIRFLATPGAVVQQGQPMAKVYNAFGRLQETLVAADEALVLGHTDSSVAYPGAPVFALAVKEK